jgi:hypothetical protein
MKIHNFIPALAAVVGLALVSAPVTVKAQATTNAATATAPKTKKKSDYTPIPKGAKISAIDASSVTVTTAKGDLKLAVAATTVFEVNKKPAAASDFAVGDVVTGSYSTGSDGTLTAYHIRKKAAAAAAPAAAPAGQ